MADKLTAQEKSKWTNWGTTNHAKVSRGKTGRLGGAEARAAASADGIMIKHNADKGNRGADVMDQMRWLQSWQGIVSADNVSARLADWVLVDKVHLAKQPSTKSLYIELVRAVLGHKSHTFPNMPQFELSRWPKYIIQLALSTRASAKSACASSLLDQMEMLSLAQVGNFLQKVVLGYGATAGPHVFWPVVEVVASLMLSNKKRLDVKQFSWVVSIVGNSPLRWKEKLLELPDAARANIGQQMPMVAGCLKLPRCRPFLEDPSHNAVQNVGEDKSVTPDRAVTEDVFHNEAAAQISPHDASLLADASLASWIQHNAASADLDGVQASSAMTYGDAHSASASGGGQLAMQEPYFDKVYLLRMSRNPQELDAALTRGEELETTCASLAAAGFDVRLPSGALMLVRPEQYLVVKQAVARLTLRPFHVVVSDVHLPLVQEALTTIPSRRDVRIRSTQNVGYIESSPVGNDACEIYILEKTFLDIPRPMRNSDSVIQSTTEAHRGTNPRRCVEAPQLEV